jgi:aspartyl-tRNA(Asn)/glutamyl-tRNA(Gln) amidotransferase subunit C
LGEVDVTGIEPMTAVIPNQLRLRDDVIVNADPLTGGGGAMRCWPMRRRPNTASFGVPKVIE